MKLFRWLLVVVTACLCCCSSGVNSKRDTVATGDLRIPCQGGCPASRISPTSAQAMPAGCAEAAVADLPARWKLPHYPSSWRPTSQQDRNRGPHPNTYQAVSASQVPPTCNPTSWAWARLLQTIKDTIALQLNYCYHHAPAYETPSSVQQRCSPPEDDPGAGRSNKCVCSAAGMHKANPWKGVDCSNFAAFVYNFAFGFYPTSAIGDLACHPTRAPGRLLSGITTSKLDQLNPGDLVFITLSRSRNTAPVRVSHVVLWTGWTVDFSGAGGQLSKAALMANVSDKEKPGMEKCMRERQAAGQPVYVIADSHHGGPDLRPFCGWYLNSVSHARRLIDPDSSLPINSDSVAFWDGKDCKSNWALQG